jgi:ribosomal protein S18 acetylase RimI-like enzyme
VPDLPAPIPVLPGGTWRPLTLDDLAAYVQLQEAARAADGGEEVTTEQLAHHELTDPEAPMATNSLALVLPDGSLAASILIQQRLDGRLARRVFLWGVTHPHRRGCGIGSAIMGWGVARAEEILAAQPDDLPRLVETFVDVRLAGALALHERAGFQPVRWYFTMRRDLGDPLPSMADLGRLVIRPFEAGWGEPVRLAHNEAFADHWGSEPQTPEVWQRDFVGDPHFRGDLSFVAFDGDEIAGYTVNYVAEADWATTGIREGWVGQLGVRRPWRKRGLATALLLRSMRAFAEAGLDAATLSVDTANPTGAVGIYERLGFRPIRRTVRLQRPYPLDGLSLVSNLFANHGQG